MSKKVLDGLYWSARSKTWHYEIWADGSKRNGDTGHSHKGLAKEMLAEVRAAAARGRAREKAGLARRLPVPTLEEAMAQWAAAESGTLTAKHVADLTRMVRRHCGGILNMPLNRLDTAKMDELRLAYLGGTWRGTNWKNAPARPRTAGGWNLLRRYISLLVNWCVERDLLEARPFKSRPVKVQDKVLPTLWPEDAGRFLALVDAKTTSQDLRTAVRLMLQLGLRENEAIGAQWEGFDLRLGVYCPPKTKNRQTRQIALPPGLVEYLSACHKREPYGPVLSAQHNPGFTRRITAKAGLAMGIRGLHPHALRATFATVHWELGTPLSQITTMLGHKDVQTTMGYIRQRPRDAAEAQAKAAALMQIPAGPPPAVHPPEENE